MGLPMGQKLVKPGSTQGRGGGYLPHSFGGELILFIETHFYGGESSQHINWLELEAIRLAVLQWGPQWRNQTVRVYWDNSTAVAYIRKQGGTHSISLFNKTLELFQLLDQFVILLNPTHLPRARNVTAESTASVLQNGGFLRKPYTICSLS